METLADALSRTTNNNTVTNVLLVSCFDLLASGSVKQQKDIEKLEAEKNSLVKANKTTKTTIWNSKHQLYAEANSNSGTTIFPLAKLKPIYGEAFPSQSLPAVDAHKEDGKSPIAKIMI